MVTTTGTASDKADRPNGDLEPARRPWPWLFATGASVAAIAGISYRFGPTPLTAPWDVFILLDGGYRITEGQIPSVDFTNPIGPLIYTFVSLGMRMQSVPSLAAVTYGALLFLAVAVTLAFTVARRRMPTPMAAAYTIYTALLVVSVRPLGYSPWTTTYAMLYNRWGWVLYVALLVLVLLRPLRQETDRQLSLAFDGLTLGLILGLLFFCKANFLMAAVGAIVVGLAIGSLPRRLALSGWAAAGFLVVVLVMWASIGISVPAYLTDLIAAAHAQGGLRFWSLAFAVAYNLPITLLALLVIGGLAILARRRQVPGKPLWRLAVPAAYILGSSVFVSGINSPEKADLPALVVIPLLLLTYVPIAPGTLRKPLMVGAAALLLATAGHIAVKDALGIGRSVELQMRIADFPTSQQISSEHLRDFVVPADSTWQTAYRTANEVPAMINDGMGLLRQHVAPGDTVVTTALTNPFSFALDLPPATGVLWWDLGISFSPASHPNPDRAFGDARWVMVPRLVPDEGCCQGTVSAILDVYGPYLHQHFTEIGRSNDWILLGRNQ